jgi:hypothetical protein
MSGNTFGEDTVSESALQASLQLTVLARSALDLGSVDHHDHQARLLRLLQFTVLGTVTKSCSYTHFI